MTQPERDYDLELDLNIDLPPTARAERPVKVRIVGEHGPEMIPVQPSTKINMQRQSRRIE